MRDKIDVAKLELEPAIAEDDPHCSIKTKEEFDILLEDMMAVDLHDEKSAHRNNFFRFLKYKLKKLNFFRKTDDFVSDVRGFIVKSFNELADEEKAEILLSYRSMIQLGKSLSISDETVMVEVGFNEPNSDMEYVKIPVRRNGSDTWLYLRNLASIYERERTKMLKEKKALRMWIFKAILWIVVLLIVFSVVLGVLPGSKTNPLSVHVFEFMKTIGDVLNILFFKPL